MAKGSKTKPNYRPKLLTTNLDGIAIPALKVRGKGHTARALPRRHWKESAPPPFEVQGYHVLTFVSALMGALWFAGLLPDP